MKAILLVAATLLAVALSAGVGCNDATDLGIFQAQASTFHATVQSCGMKCWAARACSINCLEKSLGLTPDCAGCFVDDMECSKDHCLTECATAPTSQKCLDCNNQYCQPALVQCTQVDPGVLPKQEVSEYPRLPS